MGDIKRKNRGQRSVRRAAAYLESIPKWKLAAHDGLLQAPPSESEVGEPPKAKPKTRK